MKKLELHEMDDKFILMQLYITQFFMLAIGLFWVQIFSDRNIWNLLQGMITTSIWLYGIGFGLLVVILDVFIFLFVPKRLYDDGGLNRKIFAKRSLWHIFIIATIVSFSEEILFRGAMQNSLGLWWTSLIFALVHFRYLKQWLLMISVLLVSLGLGFVYEMTGQIWTSIIAHWFIDFVVGCFIRYEHKFRKYPM